MIIKEFFINFCILCTVIFLLHTYFHKNKILHLRPLYSHALLGVFHGLFGVVLMQFGIQIGDGVLIDLRAIPMMLSAQAGGWVATSITTAIIITSRLLLYPISHSSLINIIVLMVAGTSFSLISYANKSRNYKWFYMCCSYIVIIALFIHYVIPNLVESIEIFVHYAIAIAVGTFTSNLITTYLWKNRESYDLLRKLAQKDHLTGLYNLRSYEEFLNGSTHECRKHNQQISLLMLDIDYFKSINDTYGHPAGDEVLKQVARIIKQTCRQTDRAFRYGGEEFSIVMPNSTLSAAKKLATRIQKRIEQQVFLINHNKTLNVTVSIGFATLNNDSPFSSSELIEIADQALYKAKREGRNQVQTIQELVII